MERFVVRSALVVAVVALAACSADVEPNEESAVAGVVLEREAAADEQGDASDDPAAPSERPELAITDLVVLMTGQGTSGRVWFAADGDWVGLDGQSLETGRDLAGLHLDATLDDPGPERSGEAIAGCEVRVTAPADAGLHARGTIEGELVVERNSGEVSRVSLTALPIELELDPGGDRVHVIEVATGTVDVDAERDAQVRCEGRFNRT